MFSNLQSLGAHLAGCFVFAMSKPFFVGLSPASRWERIWNFSTGNCGGQVSESCLWEDESICGRPSVLWTEVDLPLICSVAKLLLRLIALVCVGAPAAWDIRLSENLPQIVASTSGVWPLYQISLCLEVQYLSAVWYCLYLSCTSR